MCYYLNKYRKIMKKTGIKNIYFFKNRNLLIANVADMLFLRLIKQIILDNLFYNIKLLYKKNFYIVKYRS